MLGLSSQPWSEANRYLAQALTLWERDKCPGGCGHYLDETSEMDGWHEVESIVCDACRARDESKGEPGPGELRWVRSTAED